jgi:hypothetical protein
MIRTILKPESQSISIELPVNFIGKQVEVIAFTIDEGDSKISDKAFTHLASESVLAKDWLSPEDDLAWQNL